MIIDHKPHWIHQFFNREYSIGIVITLAAFLGLLCANSALSDIYTAILETQLTISIGNKLIEQTLHHWINDGLMALFFFVVGLEIKREIIDGELNTLAKATLPLVAALGGMIVPALVYLAFNFSTDQISGWGIPMATDIAFCLGLIALISKYVANEVKIFLLSLAIFDDIGAVLIIALFYSSSLDWINIGLAGLAFLVLLTANYMGIRNKWFFLIGGLFGIWLSIFFSGIHPTIAGILLAFTLPAHKAISDKVAINRLERLVEKLPNEDNKDTELSSDWQMEVIEGIKEIADQAGTPLQFSENLFRRFVYFVVVPLFAFANAGVVIDGASLANLVSPVAIGISLGLVVGKPAGILLFTWLGVKTGLVKLPVALGWPQIFGVGMLAGVGFTMSLFITGLAFTDSEVLRTAKLSVLAASFLVAPVATFYLRKLGKAQGEAV